METANFGTVLREARERRRVSLADISQQTKVSVSALQLLEAGKFADLPHETFVRGFIRSYARTVGISHVEALTLFDEAVAARRNADAPLTLAPAPRAKPAPIIPPPEVVGDDDAQAPRHGIGLAVFVIIVLLIATITLSLFLRQQPQSGEGLSLQESTDVPALTAGT
jgi:transcriptional regulator with XRE-family HTH domain